MGGWAGGREAFTHNNITLWKVCLNSLPDGKPKGSQPSPAHSHPPAGRRLHRGRPPPCPCAPEAAKSSSAWACVAGHEARLELLHDCMAWQTLQAPAGPLLRRRPTPPQPHLEEVLVDVRIHPGADQGAPLRLPARGVLLCIAAGWEEGD